jgi:Glyoxalase-like domain
MEPDGKPADRLEQTASVEDGGPMSDVSDGAAVELDHVLLAVGDLHEAARVMRDRYGLESVAGGRHPGWGTANRIVPAGDAYLELVAVVDHDTALANRFGRWVASASGRVQPLGWAVRTRSIDDVAERLELAVSDGSRSTPDGRQLRWRVAGVEQATADPSLPFFIEWDRDTPHPSQVGVTHPAGAVEISRLEVSGDETGLARWLGEHRAPVVVTRGPSAVTRVVLRCATHAIAIESGVEP